MPFRARHIKKMAMAQIDQMAGLRYRAFFVVDERRREAGCVHFAADADHGHAGIAQRTSANQGDVPSKQDYSVDLARIDEIDQPARSSSTPSRLPTIMV